VPDNSVQWAEYYRSIGKLKEAEAIEQTMRAKGGGVPPAGYPQPVYGAPQGNHPRRTPWRKPRRIPWRTPEKSDADLDKKSSGSATLPRSFLLNMTRTMDYIGYNVLFSFFRRSQQDVFMKSLLKYWTEP
jgi:hypothetical protein